ncbi:uncharacterized protein DUF4873 [Nocardia fluminea]|uniref:Uncharacterized protein DUF4873 n=2 Tax=Nocardia TaxID=1817 RepID=A0A2N3VDC6_9NOCA|nr:uncharacterized protein DUF4873 [Nocardia fluminea]
MLGVWGNFDCGRPDCQAVNALGFRRRPTTPAVLVWWIPLQASAGDHAKEATVNSHSPHDDSDYIGSATVIMASTEVEVQVELRGFFQPIDGRFCWYGRVGQSDILDEFLQGRRRSVVVRTSAGEAAGTIGDRDFWGRYRIQGRGRPPYPTPSSLDEVEATPS